MLHARLLGFKRAGEVVGLGDPGRLHRGPGPWLRLLHPAVVNMQDPNGQPL